MKKFVSMLFILICLLFVSTSVFAADTLDLSDQQITSKMTAMKSKYPEGMKWTNDNTYSSKTKLGAGYISGGGCHGFALILSDAAFDDAPFIFHKNTSDIKVGDILRINDDNHSVMVISKTGNKLTIAEGNYNSSIHWGRTLDLSNLKVDYIMSRLNHYQTVYQVVNPSSSEPIYTTDGNEYKTLQNVNKWNGYGICWYAPINTGEAVFRLYNSGLGIHLYTTDKNEVQVLTTQDQWVTDFNGAPLFYSGGDMPIYRLYDNGRVGNHILTPSYTQYNSFGQNGYAKEGVALKGLLSPISY